MNRDNIGPDAMKMRLNDTYTILEEIGSGGGGVVYKAYHERLKTEVVVKKIRERVRERLEDRAEVDILKDMKHTYLPRVYDYLEIEKVENGEPVRDANGDVITEVYTVIDFIKGESLDKVIARQGPIPQKRVLKWALQLAEALEYLHTQKPPVIHSDIKPANIMLTPEDNICLIDFNISLALDQSLKNSTGISGGYSPPEQYGDTALYYGLARTQTAGYSGNDPVGTQAAGQSGNDPVGTWTAGAPFDCSVDETLASASQEDWTRTSVRTAAAQEEETVLSGAAYDPSADETVAAGRKDDATRTSFQETRTQTQAGGSAASGRHADTPPTASGLIEQTIGRGVDTRSDIYSLGATLYHLLTGIRPGYDFERITPIDQCGVDISEGFAVIINRMMELDPDRRYQSGTELLEALRNIHELDSEYQRWKRSRRVKLLLAAFLFVLGAGLTFTGTVLISNENNASYNSLILAAEDAIDGGGYEEGSTLLEEAKDIFPDKIDAYRLEALLLYSEGDYDGCIQFTEELLSNAPYTLSDGDDAAVAQICYILGNAYIETEDYGNALLYLQNALMLDAGDSLYYRDCAIVLALTGNTQQAEEMLSNAVILGLGDDSIYLVQGEIAYANQEYEEAAAQLQQAIASAESTSLRRRAVLLCDKAYRALGTDSLDAEISMLEQEMNQYSDALSAAGVAERLADAYVRMAEASGEDGAAEEYYQKALELFLELYDGGYVTSQLMENIAILYEDLDEFDGAQAFLLQMADRYPDSYVPYKRLVFLEADRQQELENTERDYTDMYEYYEQALSLYDEETEDQEMQMIGIMIQELYDGGWLVPMG